MIYDLYFHSMIPSADTETGMEPVIIKVASFDWDGPPFRVGDVIHLTDDVMVEGIMASPVRVSTVEYRLLDGHICLGVNTHTDNVLVVAHDPDPIEAQVPCLMDTKELTVEEFLGMGAR